jgi:XTP/dITP diphosphohydrolase
MQLASILAKQGLIIATHNAGKLREIQALLTPLNITCTSAAARDLLEPEENGDTFIANAMIKSRAATLATGAPSLSDDSGLVIPALGGAPGIYSARWAGEEKDFSVAFARIQHELESRGEALNTAAYFVCVLSLAIPRTFVPSLSVLDDSGASYTITTAEEEGLYFINIEGRVHGSLSLPARGAQGFGYDPIFVKDGMTQTFAEIPPEAKHAISHRANAFQGFLKLLG